MDIAAIIPARKGSTRLKNKNGLPFGDQDSLIAWKISQLKQVLPTQSIYLTTEAEDYKAIGRSHGVSIHDREPRLADQDKCSIGEVVVDVVNNISHEHIAWCNVTSPLMSPIDYANAFKDYENFIIKGEYDSLMGVNLLREYLWTDEAPLNYELAVDHIATQDLPNIYKVTNSIFIGTRNVFLEHQGYTGSAPYKMELPKLAGIDIDYPEDYDMALALYPLYQQQ